MTTIQKRFGLLGRNINYSFSRGYFTEKFEKEGLNKKRIKKGPTDDLNHRLGGWLRV